MSGADLGGDDLEVLLDAASDEGPVEGRLDPRASDWAARRPSAPTRPEARKSDLFLKPSRPPRLDDWRDRRVGWGLVLPEREDLSADELARADDAPEPIRELLARRAAEGEAAAGEEAAPVLRYRPGSGDAHRHLFLRDYRHGTDIPLDRPRQGTGPGQLPFYLLIAASPEEVPWSFQYVLNAGRAVGRLHFDGPEAEARLGRYVEHLLSDWGGESERARVEKPLAWAVDHGGGDITTLLRRAISARAHRRWLDDDQLEPRLLDGRRGQATAAELARALAEDRPALVLGTSHGRTAPLTDPAAMGARLGLPVDQDHRDLDPRALLADWRPGGALWVAWGCCTAGSDAQSLYTGLFDEGSSAGRVLRAVSALGNRIAPLPQALLGAASPLGAFVGQVEPTFDWTLRQPSSKAHLSAPLVSALYDHLFQPWPIGLALRPWYDSLGTLYTAWERTAADLPSGSTAEESASSRALVRTLLYLRLAIRDIQSTVILGDPTVRLPALP